jgi:hypothetical protein
VVAWLVEGAAGALDGLVRRNGIEPDNNGYWLTEVVGEGLGRTDLEYRWGDPSETRVVVEAKIGHVLTVDQIAGYADRLRGDAGLLVRAVVTSTTRGRRRPVPVCRCQVWAG